jgi:hypothetical protein
MILDRIGAWHRLVRQAGWGRDPTVVWVGWPRLEHDDFKLERFRLTKTPIPVIPAEAGTHPAM